MTRQIGHDNRVTAPKIPQYHELMWPALQATKELGGSATVREMNERAMASAGITEEQQAVPHGEDGRMSEVEYRLHWARTILLTGAAITTATSWLQNRHCDRAEQQRELQAAKGQLIASATSVIVLVGWYHGARSISPNSSLRNTLGTETEWVEKIANALERLQMADRVIQLHGQSDVAQASDHVVPEAACAVPAAGACSAARRQFALAVSRRASCARAADRSQLAIMVDTRQVACHSLVTT